MLSFGGRACLPETFVDQILTHYLYNKKLHLGRIYLILFIPYSITDVCNMQCVYNLIQSATDSLTSERVTNVDRLRHHRLLERSSV